ncbi:MAG: DUF368 domain-containing protein [Candidatus Methanomethylophilaceae archaeon]|nr:DUF368 domain-containing protein [Candidatus Methanomethylophilaceae archaeon]
MMNRNLKDLMIGTLTGIISMLPGASGATILVIFGLYERLIRDLAHIRDRLLKDLRFIIVILIGVFIGMMICAFGLEFLIERWEIPTMFFFAALILAQVPDIWELGQEEGGGVTYVDVVAFMAGVAIMIGCLFLGEGDGIEASPPIMVLVGIIFAISKMAPGISGSTILLALGLYTPLMSALTDFDLGLLMPVGIGLLIGVFGMSKIMDVCITRYRRPTYSAILGLTVGSIITVTIQAYQGIAGTGDVIGGIVGIVLGIVLGILLSRIASAYAKETVSGN